jgi:hypothetical protein
VRLQALIQECGELTEWRNTVIHPIVATDEAGQPPIGSTEWKQLPHYRSLNLLSSKLPELANTLNSERLSGFIALALEQR